MDDRFALSVREIQLIDIDLIADYWLNSDADFLINMGVDLKKLPTRNELIKMLIEQLNTSIAHKKSFALIWELNNKQIGHSNVNEVKIGKEATLHLHLWKSTHRKKGIGVELVKKSLPFYFEKLKLKRLICEPYALNTAPNKTLKKIGFEFIKKHRTIPGSLNFEQEVNRWELTKENYKRIAIDKKKNT